jgi:ATPase subunit of ABC transporter with duplicated ATPase domains
MLTVSQLSKSFAGRVLFDDVSLQVNRGDRIGLVGPNGAGKSTLFALLRGALSIQLSDRQQEVLHLNPRKDIGHFSGKVLAWLRTPNENSAQLLRL